jgi:hypothetical protein
LNTVATIPAALPCTSMAACRVRAAPRAWPTSNRRSRNRPARLHRHRPHPLGHPRRPGHAQRPPALLADRRNARIALVHNGIIENHDELRRELTELGYKFTSQTDTEVIAHLVDHMYNGDLFETVQQAVKRLHGAYAIAVFCREEPHRVVAARQGSPLIVGVGKARTSSPRTRWRWPAPPTRSSTWKKATWSTCNWRATGSSTSTAAGRARSQNRARPHRRGRAGPVPPLHAEGNLRAAARGRRHPRGRHRHHAGTVRRRRL